MTSRLVTPTGAADTSGAATTDSEHRAALAVLARTRGRRDLPRCDRVEGRSSWLGMGGWRGGPPALAHRDRRALVAGREAGGAAGPLALEAFGRRCTSYPYP